MPQDHPASRIVRLIERLEGTKIVTLVRADGHDVVIDVSPEGVWGYEPGHALLWRSHVASALHEGGGMTIRQFLSTGAERLCPDGLVRWLPDKAVRGLFLGHGAYRLIPPEEMEWAQNHDATTGEPLPAEPGVTFPAWDEAAE